ncbi:hypothetical protein GCM10023238_08410 [Streptomyces heliomycini]
MYGLTPEGVGIAVRRALAHATDWTDYDWQVIHEGPQSPAVHMALDEVLTAEVAAGRRPPTLRVWEWGAPAVIIGSFQSLRNEVDTEGARRHGVEVVRRISGGGAMFVEPGNTITYSLSVPEALVQGLSFQDSYAYLDDWVLGALGEMGIRAWYQPLNDIATDQGKIAGAARSGSWGQDGGPGAVLHHVTMAYDIDADKMLDVLRIGREKLSDKGTKSAKKRVDPLRGRPVCRAGRHRADDRLVPRPVRVRGRQGDGRGAGPRGGTGADEVHHAGLGPPACRRSGKPLVRSRRAGRPEGGLLHESLLP